VSIEVRNRYRKEDVISTKTLRRFRDYEIDYALGRIYFKAPVYSNDEQFNPRYIVVDYEVSGDNAEHYTYGGRAAVKGFNETVEVGSTYISEDSGKKKSKLLGVDTTIQMGKTTRLKAEYAKTKTTQEAVSTTGDAKLVELEHMGDGLYTRAYYREQASSFGLGQLNGSLGGTRKIGVDVAQEFSNRQTNRLSLYRDTNLLSGMSSDVLDFRTEFNNLTWSSFLGYRYAKESSDDFSAQQLLFGGSYSLFDQRLRLSAQREQTISSDESKQFPTKTTVGLEYALSSSTELFSAYEWSDEMEQGRVGLRVRPWSGMTIENTTLSELHNDQQNVYNTLGGMQTYQVNDNLSFNVGYEKGQALSKGAVDNNLSALASKDFSAYRLGFNYTKSNYTANVNAELRKSEEDEKRNISASVYTQTSDELALALGASSHSDSGKNRENSNEDIQFSLAYRPEEEDMLVLEKLAYVRGKQEGEAGSFVTEKTVNNLNVNLKLSSKAELSLQHGFKYVTDSIESFDSKGISQLVGVDTHYDLSSKWELGLQGSLLYAQSANNFDYGLGLYSGHNLFDNMLLTVGYNWKGFEDRDFSLQTYRVEGPYFRFNMKFDQESLKDTVRMMSW